MNLFAEFLKLLPNSPVLVCSVVDENPDGTSRVLTLDNQPLVVLGGSGRTVGAKVFVQDNRILGDAPTLPVTEYEI
jgi:hypothetical protein